MTETSPPLLGPGSLWRRWDPHVHAPGTIFNDQFKGDWEAYLAALEGADPPIAAVGVTDYYSIETYRRICAKRDDEGRLSGCGLIFPNVELRLSVGTAKAWLNAHLLICPDDPDHLEQTERFLARLTFRTAAGPYCCSPADLTRLGRELDPTKTDARAALRHGSEQFKVSFDQLRDEYRDSAWAQANILIAVAGAKGDGTSALQEGADGALRREIERFAHIIFASSVSQREYWLGRKTSAEHIVETYGGLKPCLHGSDGHSVDRAAAPDGDRYTWIKGAPSFDALRQACIDPASRAYVGSEPPPAAAPSETIAKVFLQGTPWAVTPSIALNPGLVTIIGARGSGKTALADIIAAGCDAHGENLPAQAFLIRANEYLGGASVRLDWAGGTSVARALDDNGQPSWDSYPRAR